MQRAAIVQSSILMLAAGLLSVGYACRSNGGEYRRSERTAARSLALGEAPDDHTIFFRKNHGGAASARDAKCSSCHLGVSGSPTDSCMDCHATMRPRDHTLRWRGPAHGRSSAIEPTRCATCHEADVCSSCHAVPPPSHSPLRTFRFRHARPAARNPRSCLTCHTFESTCIDCHALDVAPPVGLR
ncbi:MAG: cytochrome c3 family protein [Deltaproteobacteria bacterium]